MQNAYAKEYENLPPGRTNLKWNLRALKIGFQQCLVKSFQSKKFQNTSKEQAKKEFKGTVWQQKFTWDALCVYNAIADRLGHCFALLFLAENLGEILTLSLLFVAEKVRRATSAWYKQTVLKQIDKSDVRKSGGPNSINLKAL